MTWFGSGFGCDFGVAGAEDSDFSSEIVLLFLIALTSGSFFPSNPPAVSNAHQSYSSPSPKSSTSSKRLSEQSPPPDAEHRVPSQKSIFDNPNLQMKTIDDLLNSEIMDQEEMELEKEERELMSEEDALANKLRLIEKIKI